MLATTPTASRIPHGVDKGGAEDVGMPVHRTLEKDGGRSLYSDSKWIESYPSTFDAEALHPGKFWFYYICSQLKFHTTSARDWGRFTMNQSRWLSNGYAKPTAKRPLRIAGASGGVFDRFRSIEDFAEDPTIDVIFGDWMSEISMAFRGSEKADRQASRQELEALSFEMSFIAALKPGMKNIAKHKQKVAVNAGACDAEAMARRVQDLCEEQGTRLKVAWVTGDDVCTTQKSCFV
jgi:Acyclic terpene utilisation family protein AtuA